jgi:hypothetical protein
VGVSQSDVGDERYRTDRSHRYRNEQGRSPTLPVMSDIRLNLLPIQRYHDLCMSRCQVSVALAVFRVSIHFHVPAFILMQHEQVETGYQIIRHWVNRISEHIEMSTLCFFRYGIGLRELSSTKFYPTSDKRHNDGCLGC